MEEDGERRVKAIKHRDGLLTILSVPLAKEGKCYGHRGERPGYYHF